MHVPVALKIIPKSTFKHDARLSALVENELIVLTKSSHSNIMNIYEVMQDDEYLYVVSELLEGGELFDRILDEEKFSERKTATVVR